MNLKWGYYYMYKNISYIEIIKNKCRYGCNKNILFFTNMSLKPIFDNYIKYYMKIDSDIQYFEIFNSINNEKNHEIIFFFYDLKILNEKLYDEFYIYKKNRIDKEIEKVKEFIDIVIKKLFYTKKKIIIISFWKDYTDNNPINFYSWNNYVDEINLYLQENSINIGFTFIDIDKIICEAGFNKFFDFTKEHLYNNPFSWEGNSFLAYKMAKEIKKYNQFRKKCLIVDCDEVLWGGILVEEGYENIVLSKEGIGKFYRTFQRELIKLSMQGIYICLCSKNNEEDIWNVFNKNSNMLLKKEHISAFRINWKDKVENIQEISQELNIGLDSIVFIDDNKYEILQVNSFLPEVFTIIYETKYLYKNIQNLRYSDLFQTLYLSNEDKERSNMLIAQKKRKEIKKLYNNIKDFKDILSEQIEINIVNKKDLRRISELIQKTNQFNLSDSYYDYNQICNIYENKDYDIIYIKVSDIFGDLGIVGCCILQYSNNKIYIDTFCISCRVFGRNFEYKLLEFVKILAQNKQKVLIGIYKDNVKNKRFSSFYKENHIKEK